SEWHRNTSFWIQNPQPTRIRAYVFDDRRIYQPGETMYLKGWLRRSSPGPEGDLLPFDGAGTKIEAVLRDEYSVELEKKAVVPGPNGGFDLSFDVPAEANLGYANIAFTAQVPGEKSPYRFSHNVQIEAFRTPKFEVAVDTSAAPHIVGEFVEATATAKYYSGGPLADAQVRWRVASVPADYAPAGHSTYRFGTHSPWWVIDGLRSPRDESEDRIRQFIGQTNPRGQHQLRVDVAGVDTPRAHRLSMQAAVSDVNRQTWTGSSILLVHPSQIYVGLRSTKGFGETNQPFEIEGIVVDIDGATMARHAVTATVARLAWKQVGNAWEYVETKPQPCSTTADEQGRFVCRFVPQEGGRYIMSARVQDQRGRDNVSTLNFWVAGATSMAQDQSNQADRVILIPDKKEYAPGDTARILIRAPFPNAEGLYSIERQGIAATKRFTIQGVDHTLEIPIEAHQLPSIGVAVELVGEAPRKDIPTQSRPAFAHGRAVLAVDKTHRRLQVEVSPQHKKRPPGSKTTVDVNVTTANGEPVPNAEVAIMVVDEAILALTKAQTPDPLPSFYVERTPGVTVVRTRDRINLARTTMLAKNFERRRSYLAEAAMADSGVESVMVTGSRFERSRRAAPDAVANRAAIAIRRHFSAVAAFLPKVRTDAVGRAQATFTLPDNLTRYRVMAVVADDARRFGSNDASITAVKPLSVRPSPPRFLNYGDVAQVPFVVHNQGDRAERVNIALRASNAQIRGAGGLSVSVPAGDRREVRFEVTTDRTGTAEFQVAMEAADQT
ncbi:MAG: alpha-2-macroglobulin family protein, partial [Myxococcota bacterium]